MTDALGAIQALVKRRPELSDLDPTIGQALSLLTKTFSGGGRLYVAGNGGSAADAEHIVGELMKGMARRRPPGRRLDDVLVDRSPEALAGDARYVGSKLEGALPAVCLTSQSALVSAISNDTGADMVMAQQLYGYGRAGDTFFGLSTSGSSRNVVLAALTARALDMQVLALTGRPGLPLGELADVWLAVPGDNVARVQELHSAIYHTLCEALEDHFFPADGGC